jgi:hypothetical protein
MPRPIEYKVLTHNTNDINAEVAKFAASGWRPLLMSTCINSATATSQVQVTVILELRPE